MFLCPQQYDNDLESNSSKVKDTDFLASVLGDSDPGILIFSGMIFCACARLCVCVWWKAVLFH